MVIKEKIEFEIKAGRVKGPFKNIPFPDFQISPISVREKSTPGTYRLIHNLSFPHNGSSINENIDACYKSVQYSNINSAITSMLNLPIGAYSAKSDIQDAFRLIPIKARCTPEKLTILTKHSKTFFFNPVVKNIVNYQLQKLYLKWTSIKGSNYAFATWCHSALKYL